MYKNIFLIRHGLTESNKKKIYAGWSKEELCEKGVRDLLEEGEKIKKYKIEKIYSSPIRRAVQSAEIINGFLDVGIEIDENFKEMKLGPWEGLKEKEIEKKFPFEWRLWNEKPSRLQLDGRETLKELQDRALKGVEIVSKNSSQNNILVVTHVALIRVLFIYFNGLSLDEYRKIDVPNGGLFLLDKEKKRFEKLTVL